MCTEVCGALGAVLGGQAGASGLRAMGSPVHRAPLTSAAVGPGIGSPPHPAEAPTAPLTLEPPALVPQINRQAHPTCSALICSAVVAWEPHPSRGQVWGLGFPCDTTSLRPTGRGGGGQVHSSLLSPSQPCCAPPSPGQACELQAPGRPRQSLGGLLWGTGSQPRGFARRVSPEIRLHWVHSFLRTRPSHQGPR